MFNQNTINKYNPHLNNMTNNSPTSVTESRNIYNLKSDDIKSDNIKSDDIKSNDIYQLNIIAWLDELFPEKLIQEYINKQKNTEYFKIQELIDDDNRRKYFTNLKINENNLKN